MDLVVVNMAQVMVMKMKMMMMSVCLLQELNNFGEQ